MTATIDWSAAGYIATALAAKVAAWQFPRATAQARVNFVDDVLR